MPLVSLLYQLMGTNNYPYIVDCFKLLNCSFSKQPPCSSGVELPCIDIFFWVGPHQIAEWPRSRYLYIPLKGSYCINSGPFWRQSPVNTKDLTLYDCCEGQIIKSVIEVIPNVMIAIFFCYLIIKAIYVCDISRLMVSSQQHDHLGIFHLVQKQEQNGLD